MTRDALAETVPDDEGTPILTRLLTLRGAEISVLVDAWKGQRIVELKLNPYKIRTDVVPWAYLSPDQALDIAAALIRAATAAGVTDYSSDKRVPNADT